MPQLTGTELRNAEKAIRRDLPGWKLSSETPSQKKHATGMADGLSVKRVGDFEQLQRKFLSKDISSGVVSDAEKAATRNPAAFSQRRVKTVLVEPVDGGSPKIADIVNGHVTIVQG